MSNLPDDFGTYRSKCGNCGGWNHASGCEVCPCSEASGELQDTLESSMKEITAAIGTWDWRVALRLMEQAHTMIESHISEYA